MPDDLRKDADLGGDYARDPHRGGFGGDHAREPETGEGTGARADSHASSLPKQPESDDDVKIGKASE